MVEEEHDYNCSYPTEEAVWNEYITVKAVNKWCSNLDFVADPHGITALVIRTQGQSGTELRIKGPNGTHFARTGNAAGYDSDFLYYPTGAGDYEVSVEGEPSEVVKFTVGVGQKAWLDFKLLSVSQDLRPRHTNGWSGRVTRNDSGITAGNGVSSVIVVRGGAKGLPMHLNIGDAFCYTGTKPEHGPDACEFGGLWPGLYTVTLEGTNVTVEVYVDGVGLAEVTFDHK